MSTLSEFNEPHEVHEHPPSRRQDTPERRARQRGPENKKTPEFRVLLEFTRILLEFLVKPRHVFGARNLRVHVFRGTTGTQSYSNGSGLLALEFLEKSLERFSHNLGKWAKSSKIY